MAKIYRGENEYTRSCSTWRKRIYERALAAAAFSLNLSCIWIMDTIRIHLRVVKLVYCHREMSDRKKKEEEKKLMSVYQCHLFSMIYKVYNDKLTLEQKDTNISFDHLQVWDQHHEIWNSDNPPLLKLFISSASRKQSNNIIRVFFMRHNGSDIWPGNDCIFSYLLYQNKKLICEYKLELRCNLNLRIIMKWHRNDIVL